MLDDTSVKLSMVTSYLIFIFSFNEIWSDLNCRSISHLRYHSQIWTLNKLFPLLFLNKNFCDSEIGVNVFSSWWMYVAMKSCWNSLCLLCFNSLTNIEIVIILLQKTDLVLKCRRYHLTKKDFVSNQWWVYLCVFSLMAYVSESFVLITIMNETVWILKC